MDVSNIIVMSFAIIILLLFVVFSMELLVPLQLKFEMNGICRSYIYKIESNGDLSIDDKNSLVHALNNIGLTYVSVDIDKEGNHYGDKVAVKISCQLYILLVTFGSPSSKGRFTAFSD